MRPATPPAPNCTSTAGSSRSDLVLSEIGEFAVPGVVGRAPQFRGDVYLARSSYLPEKNQKIHGFSSLSQSQCLRRIERMGGKGEDNQRADFLRPASVSKALVLASSSAVVKALLELSAATGLRRAEVFVLVACSSRMRAAEDG